MRLSTQRLQKRTMVPPAIMTANCELMRKHRGIMVECGVWKGGMMAEMMNLADLVIGYDSFEGLPDPEPHDGPAALNYSAGKDLPDYYDNCRADFDDVN